MVFTGFDLWVQELERRARDKYGAFDRVNAELH
jgi:hypothetical protein